MSSIKLQVTAITLVVFVLSGTVVYFIHQLVILPSFQQLEREEAVKSMERVLQAINRDLENMMVTAADWAHWDDMHRFAAHEGKDPGFIESNLDLDSLESLKVNLLSIYTPRGKRLWGKAVNLATGKFLNLGDLSAPRLPSLHPVLRNTRPGNQVPGIVQTPFGPLLMVSTSILRNDRSGPSTGIFVLGRFLDEEAMGRISAQTRLELSLENWTPLSTPPKEWVTASGTSFPHTPIDLVETRDAMFAQTIIGDLPGSPFLKLQTATPRSISSKGERAVNLALLSIGLGGILVMGFLWLLLHHFIVSPLAKLTAHAIRVRKRDDLQARIFLDRADEIGTLAQEINRMMAALCRARRRLVERSYCSGMSEMARGVLHNVGNAITPLTVRLASLEEELNRAPAGEWNMAFQELRRGTENEERQEDLARFVELAGSELSAVVMGAREELSAIAGQMNHVQEILNQQDQYSRNSMILEPLKMEEMVLESEKMLSPKMREKICLEVEASVHDTGKVLGSRITVQQVVSNILINASESLLIHGQAGGRIVVSGFKDHLDGRKVGHFLFRDNGPGMETESLERMFERGFSTKDRGSGQGLHWCANAVNTLNGKMYAESEGPGKGLCLHLLLPLASEGKRDEQSGGNVTRTSP